MERDFGGNSLILKFSVRNVYAIDPPIYPDSESASKTIQDEKIAIQRIMLQKKPGGSWENPTLACINEVRPSTDSLRTRMPT